MPPALLLLLALALAQEPATPPAPPAHPLAFIHTGFENASPLQWTIDPDGTVQVEVQYDYERDSPNRAAGHWHFQLQGRPHAELTLVLRNFDNVWNGTPGVPVSKKSICFTSSDGRRWTVIPAEYLEDTHRVRLRVTLDAAGTLYLARIEPYRISDLERLLGEIKGHPLVAVEEIGRTVEGRPLEIVRVGRPDALRRVLLRARAHAWEPGGNWVVEGLVRALLADDATARRALDRYCLYVLPMANKDGVARGRTRFNALGKDLNRNWDRPADPALAPENAALERWLEGMIARGRKPDFAMDLHNDEGGGLHLSRPPVPGLEAHLGRMRQFEALLRRHTWFTEGASGAAFRNAGTLGEGLLARYGIDACILEFNCNWAAGLGTYPTAAAWRDFGRGLRGVFIDFFPEPAR
jgi:murein tripeptide amidase MpaA